MVTGGFQGTYRLHKEFYPDIEKHSFGHVVWRTTSADSKKPSYGTKVEDYEVKTVILPLIAEEDIEMRIRSYYGKLENICDQVERSFTLFRYFIKNLD